MTKVDIFSGFLGAGKTTLIKKLMQEAYKDEKLVLIENEFGEIGIDGGFLQDAGVEVTEMNAGCICCSLVGDFGKALLQVLETYHPDRILIEPSGVGKLSDVMEAVQRLSQQELQLNACVTVADAGRCRLYMKNFGEFYNDQIAHAGAIVLSRTDTMPEQKLLEVQALLREKNATATIITTPWDQLQGMQIVAAAERRDTLEAALAQLTVADASCPVCGHGHHHEHDHEHDATCDHDHTHHHHHDHAHEQEHHHAHEHTHDAACGHHHEHEHAHSHVGDSCSCGCDGHHHHADEVFGSWGVETAKTYTTDVLQAALDALADEHSVGMVLRAKGILPTPDGAWLHFDYVPGESQIRMGSPAVCGRLCVIGASLREDALRRLFQPD